MTDDSFEGQLPDDLKHVADALRNGRPVADGPMLERVLRRASAGPQPRRSWRLLTPRTAMTMTLALACALGVKLAHLNVAHAVTMLAGNTSSLTSGPSSSAAGAVYCGEGSGSGSSGWAPTFRWHYGFPTPNPLNADDGWSASVQPTCPNGSLSIRWSDNSLSLSPGSTLDAGYDFHTSNQPAFNMTAYNPTVVFSPIKCANNSTPTASTVTLAMSTKSYQAPANSPQWIPTGDKTSALGFQGTLTVPDVCHGAKVVFSGGTFSAVIKIS